MPIDLTEYENRLHLRDLELGDFDALVVLQEACFPDMEPWTLEEFRSQLSVWKHSQVGLFLDDQLVATAAQLIVHEDDYDDFSDWDEVSDQGFIRNHDPEGDTLYGIEMQVHPVARGMKLSRRLYDWRKDLARDRNLARLVIGGRIPGYSDHADTLTPAQYVEAVQAKTLHDPVLTSQLSNGFALRELIPAYLPDDDASGGFATFLEWTNLDHVRRGSRRKRRAVQPVRVSLVQYQMRRISNFEEFERQCTFFVDTASDYRSDFVLFPELFTLQLLSIVAPERPGLAARTLAQFTPRYLELFADLAVRYNINVIGGTQFTLEDDRLYNIAYLFQRDGTISQQKKLHPTPSEAHWWGVKGGDTLSTIETDRGRVGILICYDVQFPELGRKLAADGARLLFVPYNTNDLYGHQRVRACTQARCIENHMFAVTAGCVGNLPFVENADVHYGRSAVITPSDVAFPAGGIAIEAEANLETCIAHDLDLEALRRHRRAGTVRNWSDRRKDLYQVVWTGDGTRQEI